MSTLKHTFTSDDKDVVRAFERMQKEVTRLHDSYRKLNEETKRGGKEAKKSTQDQSSELVTMAKSMLTVGTAIATVRAAWGDYLAMIQEVGRASKEMTDQLLKSIVTAGDIQRADEIQQFVGSIQGATRQQGMAAYDAVRGALPTASLDRVKDLARVAAGAGQIGEDAGAFGGLIGELDKMAPEKSPMQLRDLATALRANAGKGIDKVGQEGFMRAVSALQQTGAVGTEQALGMGLAAMQANQSPEILSMIASKLTAQMEPITGRMLNEDERQFNKFARADPAQRLAMLQSFGGLQQRILGAEGATKFGAINAGAVDENTQALITAQAMRQFDRTSEDLRGSVVGQRYLRGHEQSVDSDRAVQGIEAGADAWQRTQDFVESWMNREQLNAVDRFRVKSSLQTAYAVVNSPLGMFTDRADGSDALTALKMSSVPGEVAQEFIDRENKLIRAMRGIEQGTRNPSIKADPEAGR